MTALHIEPTQYTVCGLPEDDPNAYVWSLTIEHRGIDSWAIARMGQVWKRTKKGGWDYEPLPTSRTDHFLKMHRFTLEEAMAEAPRAYETLIINGLKVVDGQLRSVN